MILPCEETLTTQKQRKNFFKKIMYDPNTECSNWIGATTPDGYGMFNVKGKMKLAHRVAWVFSYGSIPPGCVLDHTCKNPSCVNVLHLEPVTPAENLRRGDAPNSASVREPLERIQSLVEAYPLLELYPVILSSVQIAIAFGTGNYNIGRDLIRLTNGPHDGWYSEPLKPGRRGRNGQGVFCVQLDELLIARLHVNGYDRKFTPEIQDFEYQPRVAYDELWID